MKLYLFTICILFSSYIFGQINLDTSFVFIDNITYLELTDKDCANFSQINIDNERLFLFDVVNCSENKKNKIYIFKKDNAVYYVNEIIVKQLNFNYNFADVNVFFKSMSKKELVNFQNRTQKENERYYAKLKEGKRLYQIQQELLKEEAHKKRIKDSIELVEFTRIEELKNLSTQISNDSIRAIVFSKKMREDTEKQDQIINKLKLTLEKGKKNGGILLTQFNVVEGDYSISLEFEIFNCSNKRIKYVEFTVKAFNDVNDQVQKSQTLKGIGFIERNSYGSWEFDDVWFSEIISSAQVSSIKLTFEDGTFKNITSISEIIDYSDLEIYNDYYMFYNGRKVTNIGVLDLIEMPDLKVIQYADINTGIQNDFIIIDSTFIADLKLVVDALNSNISDFKQGIFEFNSYSNNIYLKSDLLGTTVVQIGDLKTLLERLKYN